jgi:hypothetical protein
MVLVLASSEHCYVAVPWQADVLMLVVQPREAGDVHGDSVDGKDNIAAMVTDDLWLAWLDDLLAAV